MFKALGAALAVYVCYSIVVGRVLAKSGASGRQVLREESPAYFWVVVAIYGVLSFALITWF